MWRRWGSCTQWTGNNVADVAVRQCPSGVWEVSGWSTCRCGKVWQVRKFEDSEEIAQGMLRISGGLCKACSIWSYSERNACPEFDCTLGFDHKGRCEPYIDGLVAAIQATATEGAQ